MHLKLSKNIFCRKLNFCILINIAYGFTESLIEYKEKLLSYKKISRNLVV
jgi:hypothetical protein